MKWLNSTVVVVAAAVAFACGEGTGPQGAVTLSFIGTQPGQSVTMSRTDASFSRVSADPITDGAGNTLAITSAQVVMREIEMKRAETSQCNSDVGDGDCEEFELGPVLVDVPVDGNTSQQLAVDAPPGTYDELEFKIHKISTSDEEDAAFRSANPDFAGISIKVEGTFNGQAFTYTSDLDVEQELDLSPPLVVEDNGASTNITVRLDLSTWFLDGSGDLIDPATANKGGANEGIVKENIKKSVEAFEDRDRDGEDSDEG